MSEHMGKVPGESPHDCAVAIAGALAELGVQQLTIAAGSLHVDVRARVTNLPQLVTHTLATAPGECVRIEAAALSAVFELRGSSPCSATWRCADPHATQRLMHAFRG
jgi:hypothetical protein